MKSNSRMVKAAKLVVIASLIALLFSFQGIMAATITWKLGMNAAVTSLEVQGANKMAEILKEKTGGAMLIQVYPAGQLGDSIAQIENVIVGAQEMYSNSASWNAQFVNDFNALTMPFLIRNVDHLKKFMATDIYKDWCDQFIKKHGVRILADNWMRLPRVLVLKKPITKLADLKGMKLRMPELEVYYETWKAYGTGPVVIAWAESYMAMKQGIVDGMDSPLSSVYGQKFFEVAPYVIMTNHQTDPYNVFVNEKAYQALPENLRKALTEAAYEAGVWYTNLVANSYEKEEAEMLKAGVKFIKIDTKEFVDASRPLAMTFEAKGMWSPGLFDAISAIK